MKVLDLFSGIGGFSIGLEKAGFETVAFCEIEPYCRGVLERHWPDTPIYGDVKQLTAEQLRADGIIPDVIVGGYPCQPFSVAGRQRGEEDPRHLWPEVHRLIRELRPRWVICENVSGHIKLGLDEVLSTLEAEGYTVWPFIIPACSVGAPHKRDRVYIVANTDSLRPQGGGAEPIYGVRDLSQQSEGGGTDLRGGWPVEPNVGRVVDGVPARSHRIKALGNAVVPQIVQAIGHTIMRYEREWLTI